MYAKSITRTKNGWRCIIYTSEGGARYTTIDGSRLADVIDSIEDTMRDYAIWKQEEGNDNSLQEEKKEFLF